MPANSRLFRKFVHRDPENYVVFGSLFAILAVAGYQVTKKYVDSAKEPVVLPEENAVPWKDPSVSKDAETTYKYKYHPFNDKQEETENAPPPLTSVIKPVKTTPQGQEVVSK